MPSHRVEVLALIRYDSSMEKIHFDNTFRSLPEFLYVDVKPTPIKNPRLIHVSPLIQEIGLKLSYAELSQWLNGELNIDGEQRIATRYAGHQFGVWAGQLGDGRAISLGEIISPEGKRFEIQTKGSGLTPFSRMGDGKAVIRSSVREYLCSEAMQGLKIPTTRVLALLTGEDDVYRERVEKSALVARVFPSNIRFGHFEMCYHYQKKAELDALIKYTNQTFYSHLSVEDMLKEIIQRTAQLMAQWMGVGFCHGVMNTDNMSILGLTIDYGPFGFLEDTVLNYICNHSDHAGRYAYNQQPNVAHWDLSRLLMCFSDHVPQDKLQALLDSYPAQFEESFQKIIRQKLGLKKSEPDDFKLFMQLLQSMAQLNLDFTFTFRQLSHYQKGQAESLKAFWDFYGNRQEMIDWLKIYDERLSKEVISEDERLKEMKQMNPKYVLKNYVAQEVIHEVEQGSDQRLKEWLEVLYHPFDEHPAFEQYSLPTPYQHKNIQVSCSS